MEPEARPRPVPPALPPAPAPTPAPRRAPPPTRRGGFLRNNIVLVVVIAVVFGIGGIAVATGKPPRPSLDLTSAPDAAPVGLSPTTTQPPSPVAAAPASHGTAAVRIGARQVIVTYDSGLVTGLSYGAITITHPDGSNATLSINASTRYRPAGVHPKVGERALVYSTGGTARIIASRG